MYCRLMIHHISKVIRRVLGYSPLYILYYKLMIHHITNVSMSSPVKMLLQNLARKGPFFLHPCKILQNLARSCGILRDLVGFCRNLAQNSYKIPAKSRKIPRDLARSCRDVRKRTFSCKILQVFLLGCPPPHCQHINFTTLHKSSEV